MISQKNKQGWRNPWVFALAAIIVIALLNNGRMIWNAMNHRVRMLDEHYSVKSRKEEAKWVQQQAERTTLGWQARLHSPQQLKNDSLATPETARFILTASPAAFQFDLHDRDGKPLQGAQVVIHAQWPGGVAFDFKSELQESTPGHYVGSLVFPRSGNWDLLIRAEHDNKLFDLEQKVFVAVAK